MRPCPSGALSVADAPHDALASVDTGHIARTRAHYRNAIVPPGGGPPPHIHRNEGETASSPWDSHPLSGAPASAARHRHTTRPDRTRAARRRTAVSARSFQDLL